MLLTLIDPRHFPRPCDVTAAANMYLQLSLRIFPCAYDYRGIERHLETYVPDFKCDAVSSLFGTVGKTTFSFALFG